MKVALLAPLLLATLSAQTPPLTLGPFRGHVDATSMHVFVRAGAPGDYVLHLAAVVDGGEAKASATADDAHDLTLHFTIAGLEAGAAYEPWITRGDDVVLARGGLVWTTAAGDAAVRATIAFGSCSNDLTFKEQPIWGQLLARTPEALVLIGDTPYTDDGSVDGRRRRYRQFFAFPPVRAALSALPTWTTWDDHDYAYNDAFGAVKGSETARAVFVDYHAHSGYGDGERGIYTRFRRGPIEVFVLDTRSFADTATSPLAPGERTLLGASQITWLQQGLRASTAPCKVLVCGMVWNEGVRPNKADCWGNWLPERDALFRWLGAQHIEGVVLIGGDVHRSRVILHPSAALAGYDLPEFVTSPLAQSVIESNAVAVPGLEFDRGEAHSALLMTVDVAVAEPRLLATFVAGDGREFHHREVPLAALARPDAASCYRRAAAAARAAFREDLERLPEVEPRDDGVLPIGDEEALGAPWRQAVAAAAPALAAWDAAVAETRCVFRLGHHLDDDEFLGRMFLPMNRLTLVDVAAALQAIADHRQDDVRAALRRLFAYARHAEQNGSLGWYVGITLESNAAALATRLRDDREVAAMLRQHLAGRTTAAAFAATARMELEAMLQRVLADARLGDDAQAVIARRFEREVRRRFWQLVEPVLGAVAALPDEEDVAARERVRAAVAELVAAGKDQRQRLAAMDPTKLDGAVAAPALASLLSTMLLPSVDQLLDERAKVTAALRGAEQAMVR